MSILKYRDPVTGEWRVTGSAGVGPGIIEETDPTVPAWAKEPTKPTYTAAEVGALPASTKIPKYFDIHIIKNDDGTYSVQETPSEIIAASENGDKISVMAPVIDGVDLDAVVYDQNYLWITELGTVTGSFSYNRTISKDGFSVFCSVYFSSKADNTFEVSFSKEEGYLSTSSYVSELTDGIFMSLDEKASKEYVNEQISSAPVNLTGAKAGQTAVIASVDGSGKPTKWETVDLPSGGGTGVHIDAEEPTDKTVLWLDTDDDSDVGGSSGGTSIDATASVGQTIVVKEVDANGKPTKWEAADYQPRTHWSEETVLMPETVIECVEQDTDEDGAPDGIYMGTLPEGLSLNGGVDYSVVYNGTEYLCKAAELDNNEYEKSVALGNVGAFGFSALTSEPFAILFMYDKTEERGECVVVCLDGSASVTMSIAEVKHTPIPVQYVTNALPYYVNVTGVGTTEAPYVCHDTEANLYAAYSSGREMLIKLQVVEGENGTKMFYIFRLNSYIEGEGKRIYSFAYYGINAYIEITTQNGEVTAAKGSNN